MMLTPCYTSRAIFESVSNCLIYHFDDTSETAGVRRWGAINDNEYLRPDAANLAAFLFRLQSTDSSAYAKIRDAVGLTAPFFDDFKLRPIPQSPEMIQLEWTQKGSDYPFRPSQLSDGTLRFICLATALLQPSGPSVMLFDEPELGLHPYALNLLAALFQQASISVGAAVGRQVIISTQSAALVDEFAPEDVVVVERAHGESTFWRLDAAPLVDWLKEYSLGELWLKNILGGRPQSDATAIPQESFSDRGDKK
jgi:predicted ATPase